MVRLDVSVPANPWMYVMLTSLRVYRQCVTSEVTSYECVRVNVITSCTRLHRVSRFRSEPVKWLIDAIYRRYIVPHLDKLLQLEFNVECNPQAWSGLLNSMDYKLLIWKIKGHRWTIVTVLFCVVVFGNAEVLGHLIERKACLWKQEDTVPLKRLLSVYTAKTRLLVFLRLCLCCIVI